MSGRRRAPGLTWRDVARIGCELPGVEVGTAYGTPALRVRAFLAERDA